MGEFLSAELIPWCVASLLLCNSGDGVADRAVMTEFDTFVVRRVDTEATDVFSVCDWLNAELPVVRLET